MSNFTKARHPLDAAHVHLAGAANLVTKAAQQMMAAGENAHPADPTREMLGGARPPYMVTKDLEIVWTIERLCDWAEKLATIQRDLEGRAAAISASRLRGGETNV